VPIVTFTTDFGFSDGYVGAMKGVVLSLAPGATLVDITHGIAAQDVTSGAMVLAQAAPLFPPGTIHIAVVDPGVGGARADLVVESGGATFVGPDNGVLSLAAAAAPRQIYRIDAAAFRREPVSPTFHGRDVFAPTAGRLAAGLPAASAGPPLSDLVELDQPLVRRVGDRVEGTVTHVDTFGNLLTSLPADLVPTEAQVEVSGRQGTFRPTLGKTFGDVPSGALVAYVGSAGLLEIGLRDGSAAAMIGAARGSPVRLRRGP
jgi:S-adenosyl-L-methionine hydrolase (adenosine-forming)